MTMFRYNFIETYFHYLNQNVLFNLTELKWYALTFSNWSLFSFIFTDTKFTVVLCFRPQNTIQLWFGFWMEFIYMINYRTFTSN